MFVSDEIVLFQFYLSAWNKSKVGGASAELICQSLVNSSPYHLIWVLLQVCNLMTKLYNA